MRPTPPHPTPRPARDEYTLFRSRVQYLPGPFYGNSLGVIGFRVVGYILGLYGENGKGNWKLYEGLYRV